jgi:drug/metabolite transporter (DMT)-like permease
MAGRRAPPERALRSSGVSRPLLHWLLLLALVAMWGSAFALTAIAVQSFTPATLVAARLVGAAAFLSALVWLRGKRFPRERRFWAFALAIALAGNVVPFWLISFGQQEIDSGLAGILMGIMPLAVMVLAHFLVAGERLSPVKAAGFLLGFAGLVVLIGPAALLEVQGHGTLLLYELAALGGALCYAVNTIIARNRPPADPLVAAAAVTLVGALIMLPIGGPGAPAQLAAAPPGALVVLAALSLIATGIATVVFLKLVAIAGPSFTSFINYLIPVWALLVGMAFLAEQPGLATLAGLVLILGGIALSEIGQRRMIAAQVRPGT